MEVGGEGGVLPLLSTNDISKQHMWRRTNDLAQHSPPLRRFSTQTMLRDLQNLKITTRAMRINPPRLTKPSMHKKVIVKG